MQSIPVRQPIRSLKLRLLPALLVAALALAAAQPAVSFADASRATASTVVVEGDIARQIDTVLAATFKSDEPGAAVIVVKDGKTVLRKGYGMADVEKKIAIQPGDVFRIGSITKQFTAVAILMLEEEGKLSVKDEITKFLPDYPTQGKKITVEHLLTHTSGIRSYTGMPDFRSIINKDMKPLDVVDFFKNEKMDFDPGERFLYNNSGYFLLGVIIEKVSGMSYAEFVAKRMFEPLGMAHTAFEGFERNGVKRIPGYGRGRDGYTPAAPMSMTQPYAAGSLVSTVDDLARWDAAITAGKLVKSATWKRAFTPYALNNGKPTDYGYGWQLRKFLGEDLIEHGGAINGFHGQGMRLPASRVFVAVLTNRIGGRPTSEYHAERVTAIALGKPLTTPTPIKLAALALDAFEGTYRVDDKENRIVVRDGEQLTLQRGGGRVPMAPYAENEFFLPDFSHTRFRFVKGDDGKVKHMVVLDTSGKEEINPRTGDKPAQKKSIVLAQKDFDVLTGEYQLAPNFILTISRDGDRYLSQATNQGQVEIFAESDTKFFVKVINAEITFQKDADGKATGLVLTQNGREMPAKKIK
ncbi:MAG: serine hydrolase [Betaproteobacteria bacterium]|nr:serine hydrolase [Betaproteobacteria bacterium]